MKRRAQSGNVLVEFSLTLPLLALLFLGVWQFGYAFYIYARLDEAVRDGARYASLRTYDSDTSTPSDSFLAAVQNVVVYGNPGGGGNPLVPGLSTNNVSLTVSFTNSAPTAVKVAITNFEISALFTSISFSSKPVSQFPYLGTFGPP